MSTPSGEGRLRAQIDMRDRLSCSTVDQPVTRWPGRNTFRRFGPGRTIALLTIGALGYAAQTDAGSRAVASAVQMEGSPSRITGAEQVIIVLTGGYDRASAAATLQRSTGLAILISGQNAADAHYIAKEHGAGVIEMESSSQDTEQNAAYASCLLRGRNVRRVIVVTDPAHMRRAYTWFTYYGFEVTPITSAVQDQQPNPTSFWTGTIGRTRLWTASHELLGLVEHGAKRLLSRRIPCPSG